MKFSLLILGLLSPTIATRTFKRCQPIAGSSLGDTHQPSIDIKNVQQDTHVIIFHFLDLPETNIPFDFGEDYDLHSGDFKLCSKELIESGECLENQGFTLRTEEPHDKIMNKIVKENQTLHYPIDKAGYFCAIGYHESPNPQLTVIHTQPFGFITLKQHIFKDFLKYLNIFSFICLTSFCVKRLYDKSINKKISNWSSAFTYVFLLMLATFFSHICEFLSLLIEENYDSLFKPPTEYLNRIITWLLFMRVQFLIYGFLCLYNFVLNLPTRSKTEWNKLYYIYWITIMLNVFGVILYEMNTMLPIAEKLKTYTGNVIIAILFTISKVSLSQIQDGDYKLRYQKTRRLIIFTVVTLFVLGAVHNFIHTFQQMLRIGDSIDSSQRSPFHQWKIILTLEETSNYDFATVFFENIDRYATLIILIGSVFIWKDVQYDSLDNNNGCTNINNLDKELKDLALDV